MAMSSNTLGLAIAAALEAKSAKPSSPETISFMQDFWKTVAAEIIGHIQENAQVLPGITVTGSSPAGPITGAVTAAPGQIK